MKIVDYIEDSIPDYAICYFTYGDATGIEDEDQQAADEWLDGCRERLLRKYPGADVDLILRDDDEGSFCRFPAFGLACNCVYGVVAVWVADENPLPKIALPWEDEDDEDE